jgi:Protein of unknown function (DUF3313)
MLSHLVNRPAVLVVLLLAMLSGGCASATNRSSGFLENYTQLKPDPNDSRRLVYEAPDWKRADFTAVLIEPTVVRLNAADAKKVTAKEVADLGAYNDGALRKAFEKTMKVVTVAEPGALRIRAAITGVDTSSPALNVVTGVLLWPVDNGGVSVEYEVRDAITNEQWVALVGFSNGTPLQVISSFSRFGHVHSGLDHWSVQLSKIVRPPPTNTAVK